MGGFTSNTQPPAIGYATTGVTPPAALAVSTTDQFVVRLFNSAASITVKVVWRLLLASGEIKVNEQILSPDNTRAANIFPFTLFEGFLLSVHAYTTTNGIRRGMCFCQIALHQGLVAQLTSGQLIAQGYITTAGSVAFPQTQNGYAFEGRGNMRSITGTAPPAGSECNEVVPTNAVWFVHTFRLQLTTSAVVANRNVRLAIYDGANFLSIIEAASAQTAGSTEGYSFGPGYENKVPADSEYQSVLPIELYLPAGFALRTSTGALQAGDQYAAPQYLVEEWIQP